MRLTLIESTSFQVVRNDDVGDGVKDHLNILSVCGTCQVAVDFLWLISILRYKLLSNVIGGLKVFVLSRIIRKAFPTHQIKLKIQSNRVKAKEAYLMLERTTFSSKLSFLFKNRMNAVLTKYLLLQIESKRRRLSCMRFTVSSSISTRSYSDRATRKIIEVTSSKQWIHFLRSERWPPTSNTRKLRSFTLKLISTMPVVLTLERRMSCVVGKKLALPTVSIWSKKYLAESFNWYSLPLFINTKFWAVIDWALVKNNFLPIEWLDDARISP